MCEYIQRLDNFGCGITFAGYKNGFEIHVAVAYDIAWHVCKLTAISIATIYAAFEAVIEVFIRECIFLICGRIVYSKWRQ